MKSKIINVFLKKFLPIRRLLRETNFKNNLFVYLYSCLITRYLYKGDHSTVRKISDALVNKGVYIARFYTAQSYFLVGDYLSAKGEIEKIPDYDSLSEVGYLYSDILSALEQKREAWLFLEKLLVNTKREKVWVYFSNLVESPQDYYRLLELVDNRWEKSKDKSLRKILTNAALRAGLNSEALEYWNESNTSSYTTETQSKSKKVSFSKKDASIALKDLKRVLDKNNIPFFLISGTLLGCIRENDLLGHDKDIDVGVWDTHSYDELANILGRSGFFYIVPNRTKTLLVIRHINGIMIDVFIHYREKNDYWHAGVKIKWHNSPFTLESVCFLGEHYLIPKDYDKYLTENYGDWRTPKKDFDSAFDTPNMEVFNLIEMQIYIKQRDHK
ncbi:hypothetical protein [Avibacterium sp. 20-129]|uniref:hypothetical protein n=1 Tax=Avibacterium sp. 20-129 TaxID=2911525 RepID=UPI0022483E6E|nr:hypothetical protein [Avibacterium sp. 20-129]MCW9698298.1 hypothetical protein [Avibacterium sp. 20-129]